MTQAKASSGAVARVEIAVRRKGETEFKPVEEKTLPEWMAERMAKLIKFGKGESP